MTRRLAVRAWVTNRTAFRIRQTLFYAKKFHWKSRSFTPSRPSLSWLLPHISPSVIPPLGSQYLTSGPYTSLYWSTANSSLSILENPIWDYHNRRLLSRAFYSLQEKRIILFAEQKDTMNREQRPIEPWWYWASFAGTDRIWQVSDTSDMELKCSLRSIITHWFFWKIIRIETRIYDLPIDLSTADRILANVSPNAIAPITQIRPTFVWINYAILYIFSSSTHSLFHPSGVSKLLNYCMARCAQFLTCSQGSRSTVCSFSLLPPHFPLVSVFLWMKYCPMLRCHSVVFFCATVIKGGSKRPSSDDMSAFSRRLSPVPISKVTLVRDTDSNRNEFVSNLFSLRLFSAFVRLLLWPFRTFWFSWFLRFLGWPPRPRSRASVNFFDVSKFFKLAQSSLTFRGFHICSIRSISSSTISDLFSSYFSHSRPWYTFAESSIYPNDAIDIIRPNPLAKVTIND
jgi:hypothetical protein